jgi:hypothetical protein
VNKRVMDIQQTANILINCSLFIYHNIVNCMGNIAWQKYESERLHNLFLMLDVPQNSGRLQQNKFNSFLMLIQIGKYEIS